MENEESVAAARGGGPVAADESVTSTSTLDIDIAKLNRIPLNDSLLFNKSAQSRYDDMTPLTPFKDYEDGNIVKAQVVQGGETKKRSSSSKSKKSSKKSKSSKISVSAMSTASSTSKSNSKSTTTTKGRRTKAAQAKSLNNLDPNTLLVGQVTDDVYVVEKICDMKNFDGKDKYWVKWKGWGVAHNTWEPIENLDGCSELLKKFHETQANSNKKSACSSSKPSKSSSKKSKSNNKGGVQEDEPVINLDESIPSCSSKVVSAHASNRESDTEDLDDDNLNSDYGHSVEDNVSRKVHCVWPSSRVPRQVLSVQEIDREICYIIWCHPESEDGKQKKKQNSNTAAPKANLQSNEPEMKDVVIVRGGVFRKVFPHLLINYYEAIFHWHTSEESNEDVAKKAAICINQKLTLEKLEKKEKLRALASGDPAKGDQNESSMLNEALKDIKKKAGIADSELIAGGEEKVEKMEIGSDDENDKNNKSDMSEDESPTIRVRPITDKEIFADIDEFGLPADMSSSEDESERLCMIEDSESDEEDYRKVGDRFMKKVDNNVAGQVIV